MAASVAYAMEIGQPFWVIGGMGWLAREKIQSGDITAGIAELEVVLAQMNGIGLALARVSHEAHLAQCYALTGRKAEARALIDTAVAAIAAGRDAMYAAEVLRRQAEVELLLDPDATDLALSILAQADAIATAQDARAWSAMIAGTRARLMARDVGHDRARDWLDTRLSALARPGSANHPAFVSALQAFATPI